MPRTENVYTERLTVKITDLMLADLTNVATKSGEPISAVVRQAIRNYLDATDLTLGTRRSFDRRFQKRMDEIESNLKRGLEQDMARIEQGLKDSMQQSMSRMEYTLRRDVDQSLFKFSGEIIAAVRERDESKGKKRF